VPDCPRLRKLQRCNVIFQPFALVFGDALIGEQSKFAVPPFVIRASRNLALKAGK
jgi:hypothetical protein